MLSACATERDERVSLRIDAISHAERLNRKCHPRVRDIKERIDGRSWIESALLRECSEGTLCAMAIEAHRSCTGRHAAREEIDIGDGQRTSATVARGPRIRASTCRSDFENAIADSANGTASSGDAVDRNAWRSDRHAVETRLCSLRDFAFVDA